MGRLDLAKVGIDVDTVAAEQAYRIVIVSSIKQVKELGTDGQHLALSTNREALLNCEVVVHEIRPGEAVAR